MIAVTDRETRDRLSRMNAAVMGADSDPFYGAPVVIVVLADRRIGTCIYDGSLVMGNLDPLGEGGVRQRGGQGPAPLPGHRGRL